MKAYVVRTLNGNGKPRIFNTEDEAKAFARKMSKTRKTPIRITYGEVLNNYNCTVVDPIQIRWE